jgi:hypothetical protein
MLYNGANSNNNIQKKDTNNSLKLSFASSPSKKESQAVTRLLNLNLIQRRLQGGGFVVTLSTCTASCRSKTPPVPVIIIVWLLRAC